MKFKIREIKIDGMKLNYAVVGRGPPLVFLHGWTNNWRCFTLLSEYLSKYFRLYLLDLPGFGDSEALDSYSVDIQAKFVSGFIRKLKLKPEAIISHSMGAFIAAKFSNKKFAKRIILIGAPFKKGIGGFVSKLFGRALYHIDGHGKIESMIKRIIESRTITHILSKLINMYIYDKEAIDNYTMEGKRKLKKEAFVQMGVSAMDINLENLLDRSIVPVLLIYGDHDNMCSINTAKKVLAGKKGTFYFSSINNAGHSILEKPKEIAEAIRIFLSLI